MNNNMQELINTPGVRLYGIDFLEGIFLSNMQEKDVYTDLLNVKFPPNREYFQGIYKKSLYLTKMPKQEYSDYNFKDIDISKCIFHKDSKLPSNTDFFQNIRDKSLEGTVLPSGSYCNYDFSNVLLRDFKITKYIDIPKNKVFFQ